MIRRQFLFKLYSGMILFFSDQATASVGHLGKRKVKLVRTVYSLSAPTKFRPEFDSIVQTWKKDDAHKNLLNSMMSEKKILAISRSPGQFGYVIEIEFENLTYLRQYQNKFRNLINISYLNNVGISISERIVQS